MPTIEEVIQDPDFYSLPESERRNVMAQIDPDFSALPRQEQMKVVTSLKQPPAKQPQGETAKPGVSPELQQVIRDMSPMERALTGIGRGFVDIGQGAKQIGLQVGEKVGLVDEGAYDEYTRQIMEEERAYDKPLMDESTLAQGGRFVGQLAATAPIPGGVAGKVGSRMLTGAVAGGATGALLPTDVDESRLGNVALGAGAGGAGAGVFALGGKALGKVRGNRAAAKSEELGGLSKEFDVPLTVGELRGSPALQRVETLLERVPAVGTRGFREGQANQLAAAAEALVPRFSGEAGEEVQQSMGRVLQSNKAKAGELYDAVGEEAAKAGGNVDTSNVRRVVQRVLSNESDLPAEFQNKKILQDIEPYGNLQEIPFETARKLRSRLGREVRRMEKSAITGATSDEEVAAMKMLQGALEEDIGQFAQKTGGDLGEAYTTANRYYRENVVPFKDRQLRKAGSEDFDTDQIVKTFVKNDRPQLAAKMMNRLDDRGKTAVKYSILQDAFEHASDGKTPFSPAKFASRLERLGKTKNIVFNETERKQLDGFTKLARAAERAGQYAENPPTGQRAVDMAVLGGAGLGAAFEPATVFGATTAAATLSKLLTSNTGRRLLTRASGMPSKSKGLERLVNNELPRVLSIGAVEGRDRRDYGRNP